MAGLGFPPNDLQESFPQQTSILAVVEEALGQIPPLDPARTGVYIGMCVDPYAARHGLRVRLRDLLRADVDVSAWRAANPKAARHLTAAGVIGCMPNIPANRIHTQQDWTAPGFTVAAEELSGVDALRLAIRALRAGDVDAALVGASDFSCEPAHEAAARAVLPPDRHRAGDAAVALVVMRASDAREKGYPVIAAVEEPTGGESTGRGGRDVVELALAPARGESEVTARFGHAHGASGLLHVAAGAIAAHLGVEIDRAGAWPAPRRPEGPHTRVRVESFSGRSRSLDLLPPEEPSHLISAVDAPACRFYAAADAGALASAVEEDRQGYAGEVRLALVAASGDELARLRAHAAEELTAGRAPVAPGVFHGEDAVEGEVAFCYTGAAAAYPGAARSLLMAFPRIGHDLARRFEGTPSLARDLYGADVTSFSPATQLNGSSFVCQAHTELSRHVLGIEPQVSMGLSSGETNSLMAFGVWNDLDEMVTEIEASEMYVNQLTGECRSAARFWGLPDGDATEWRNWRIAAPLEVVEEAVAAEPRVYVTVVHHYEDVVIGGDAAGCERVVEALGRRRAIDLGLDMVVHCAPLEPFAEQWHRIHLRDTTAVPGIRFYTNAGNRAYVPTREAAAEAITRQALEPIDFPKTVERAYDDGVRVFVEHGPRAILTGAIGRILGDRPHLVVALDPHEGAGLEAVARSVARLWAHGVPMEVRAFAARVEELRLGAAAPGETKGAVLRLPAHAPDVVWAGLERARDGREASVGPDGDAGAPPARQPGVEALRPAPAAGFDYDLAALFGAERGARGAGSFELGAPARSGHVPARSGQAPARAGRAAAAAEADPVTAYFGEVARAHEEFLRAQQETHAAFLSLGGRLAAGAAPGGQPAPSNGDRPPDLRLFVTDGPPAAGAVTGPSKPPTLPPAATPPAVTSRPAASLPVTRPAASLPVTHPAAPGSVARTARPPEPALPEAAAAERAGDTPSTPKPGGVRPASASARQMAPDSPLAPPVPGPTPNLPEPGTVWLSREDLEVHASGRISEIFGPLFEQQDGHARQVRMPEPPLLFADRALLVEGEPGSMGKGRVVTETDVREGAWYLHAGRMAPGVVIESGQADLLLISWLGADFLNRNDRVYRLLGCDLTFYGEQPRPGDTLTYDIYVDGHAKTGPVRLFFFHYDCRIGDRLLISVRNGQAGFFTDEELAGSGGVLWDPAEDEPKAAEESRLDPAPRLTTKRGFDAEELRRFVAGDAYGCFGEGFELAASHTRTPTNPGGRLRLLDHVPEFDPEGGPWGRGYLRAEAHVPTDAWFYEGHFKNDPCMPGTLMADAATQALAFTMAAMGFTIRRDGWRFEPVPEQMARFVCRGQVVPDEPHTLEYEVFIEEVIDGEMPEVYAALLCKSDGFKVFGCRRFGLRLVPDYPLATKKEHLEGLGPARYVGPDRQIRGDHEALLACAWGRPSHAFGPLYEKYDGALKCPRLPAPPYHFMSEVLSVDVEAGSGAHEGTVVSTLEVEPDAWYFEEGQGLMPFPVLAEAFLQPCGWFASYLYLFADVEGDVAFRNLDGECVLHREVTPETGTLTFTTRLTRVAKAAGTSIVFFEVRAECAAGPVAEVSTTFGFFSPELLEDQRGLPTTDADRARLDAPSPTGPISLLDGGGPLGHLPGMASSRMRMLDEVTGFWPDGGEEGLGRIRTEQAVRPEAWYFEAHFFEDPVQPGSLGIEALVQSARALVALSGWLEGIESPVWEQPILDFPLTWRYRGQVVPTRERVVTEVEARSVEIVEGESVTVTVYGTQWVDGLRIYEVPAFAVRVRSGGR